MKENQFKKVLEEKGFVGVKEMGGFYFIVGNLGFHADSDEDMLEGYYCEVYELREGGSFPDISKKIRDFEDSKVTEFSDFLKNHLKTVESKLNGYDW